MHYTGAMIHSSAAAAAPPPRFPRQGQEANRHARTPRRQAKIFLLEDNATNELVMQSFLQIARMPAATVTRRLDAAEECFTEIVDGAYDLVILDVMLPDGESGDLACRIKAACDVPLLAYTARCSARDMQILLGLGFDAILRKPLAMKDFSAAINQYFD